jgi:hypothetical protein
LVRFLGTVLVLTVLIIGIQRWGVFAQPTYFYQSLILLATATAALYYYLIRIREERPDFFVHLYLLTIAVKLLAYGTYLGIVIWKDRTGAGANVIFFMATYALFTMVEIAFLWRSVSR